MNNRVNVLFCIVSLYIVVIRLSSSGGDDSAVLYPGVLRILCTL